LYRVPLVEGCKPVKQKLRRTHPEILIKVKAEIEKQWNAGFLEVVKYPQWVSNIVVVRKKKKKEDKIRVCLLHIDIFDKCSTYLHIFLYGRIFGLQLDKNGVRG